MVKINGLLFYSSYFGLTMADQVQLKLVKKVPATVNTNGKNSKKQLICTQ